MFRPIGTAPYDRPFPVLTERGDIRVCVPNRTGGFYYVRDSNFYGNKPVWWWDGLWPVLPSDVIRFKEEQEEPVAQSDRAADF